MTTDIEALGQSWAHAELAGDTDALDRLLADDFIAIGPRGMLLDKTFWLNRYIKRELEHDSFEWADVRVRRYGEAAIAVGRQTLSGRRFGETFTGRWRTQQVWVNQAGNWRLAALQLCPLADEFL